MKTKVQRNTQQRQVILRELLKLSIHPTAATLYEIVKQYLPKISLGTVYRNLDVLSQMGMVKKMEISGIETRYDGNPLQHYHIHCIKCCRLDDVKDLPDRIIKEDIKSLSGYDVYSFMLEFSGICPDCKNHK